MSWNYRVFKRKGEYFIGEAYYREDGEWDGGYSDTDFNPVQGFDLVNLKETVSHISDALDKPVIDLDLKKEKGEYKL